MAAQLVSDLAGRIVQDGFVVPPGIARLIGQLAGLLPDGFGNTAVDGGVDVFGFEVDAVPACREFGHGAALALAEGGQLPCGKAVGAGGAVGFLKFALFG